MAVMCTLAVEERGGWSPGLFRWGHYEGLVIGRMRYGPEDGVKKDFCVSGAAHCRLWGDRREGAVWRVRISRAPEMFSNGSV